ncbi:MAG: chloride channel protein [Pseudomonadota bacterium]|nr:chloride channel protein [Pseudomonadota bacterium]
MITVGIAAGLAAAALTGLIHIVETLAFGHSEAAFRIITDHTTWQQRLLSMAIGGIVVAVGWYLLQNHSRPVVGVTAAIRADSADTRRPPLLENISHALLQIIAVGAGAPVGREVAPRELAALAAGRLADALRIDVDTRRALVACGAAAGLASVYHVPLGGAIFALEVLLGAISLRLAVMALATSAIAVLVARLTVSPAAFYVVGQIDGAVTTVLWAAIVGACVGLPAAWFRRAAAHAQQQRAHGHTLLWLLPLAFVITGIVAIWLPQVLGNGRSAAQSAYWGLSLPICAALLLAKVAVVLLVLRCGAFGGTLAPSLSLGALFGLLVGLLMQGVWPQADVLVATLAGSAGVLAVSMRAPLTAVALVIGFTNQPLAGFLPIIAAVASAMAMAALAPRLHVHDWVLDDHLLHRRIRIRQ